MVLSEKLDGMAEAHAVGLHYPVDHRPALVAGSKAVPEILRRSDDQRRAAVVVEGAEAQQVGTVPVQLDAPRLGQPLHRYLPFQPFDLGFWDSRHFDRLPEKPVKRKMNFLTPAKILYHSLRGQAVFPVSNRLTLPCQENQHDNFPRSTTETKP